MKKKILSLLLSTACGLLLLGTLSLNAAAATGDVTINKTNFPDAEFRQLVQKEFDKDSNGILSAKEISAVTEIYVVMSKAKSIKGIEHFKYLTELYCVMNEYLTSADLSKNTALKSLDFMDCNLTELDLSQNTALERLTCPGNQLKTLDVSMLPNLTFLMCSNNELSTLNVTKNTKLTYLDCGRNPLKSFDVSKNTLLEDLELWSCSLTSLNVSNNKKLTVLNASNNQLKSLDVSANTELTAIQVGGNNITSLDVSKNLQLSMLGCENNQISYLDLSKNSGLYHLYCQGNPLTSLDLSKTKVRYLALDYAMINQTKYATTDGNVMVHIDLPATKDSQGNLIMDLSALPANFDISKAYNWSCGEVRNGKLYCEEESIYAYANYKIDNGMVTNVQFEGKTENEYVAVKSNPAACTAADGKTAAFKVTATGKGLTYQWQKSTDGGKTWSNSSSTGATTAALSITVKSSFNGMLFRCKVTNQAGNRTWSQPAKLTVTAAAATAPAITSQPTAKTVAEGSSVSFTVKATGDGLKYQWQKSTDSGKTWVNSSSTGANTATLTMTAKASYNGLQFRCKVTDKNGKSVTSSAAKLSVTSAGVAITTQPTAQTVTAGKSVSFKVTATGDGLSYQWQKSTDGGKTWVNSSSAGAATATLSMTTKASYNGLMFRCKITDKNGKSVTSSAVKLSVTAITLQPVSQSVTAGKSVTFTVTATGDGLTYQWKKSTDDGKTWVNSSSTGAKTNTLAMATKASYNGLKFKCVVTDKAGHTVTSSAATLTVK